MLELSGFYGILFVIANSNCCYVVYVGKEEELYRNLLPGKLSIFILTCIFAWIAGSTRGRSIYNPLFQLAIVIDVKSNIYPKSFL